MIALNWYNLKNISQQHSRKVHRKQLSQLYKWQQKLLWFLSMHLPFIKKVTISPNENVNKVQLGCYTVKTARFDTKWSFWARHVETSMRGEKRKGGGGTNLCKEGFALICPCLTDLIKSKSERPAITVETQWN